MKLAATHSLLIVGLAFFTGCDDSATPLTSEMHEDFDHVHKHQHTDGDDHEHQHKDNFRGTHAHKHGHSHRHGKPLHGGDVVSIGHTHHKGGASHYHAEVMPVTENSIHFHIQTENENGDPADYAIADKTIVGMISIVDKEELATEITFVAVGDDDTASEFAGEIPSQLDHGDKLRVVIPKLKLEDQRQTFSFSVSRPGAVEHDAHAASEADTNPAATSEQNEGPASESSDE